MLIFGWYNLRLIFIPFYFTLVASHNTKMNMDDPKVKQLRVVCTSKEMEQGFWPNDQKLLPNHWNISPKCRKGMKETYQRKVNPEKGEIAKLTKKQQEFLRSLHACRGLQQCLSWPNSILDNGTQKQGPQEFAKAERVVRKEYRRMSEGERNLFHAAMNWAKKVGTVQGKSIYDLLSCIHNHNDAVNHMGPSFFPWHREIVKELELILRLYDIRVSVPYWDCTMDDGLPNSQHSILWTKLFFGNGQGSVVEGPYKHWRNWDGLIELFRSLGLEATSLFGPWIYQYMDKTNDSNEFNFCINETLMMAHTFVHLWVGGLMGKLPTSASDPTFYLLHCFIDYLWERWRQTHQTRSQRESTYPTDTNSTCHRKAYLPNSILYPFTSLTNKDGLSNRYTDEFYTYQDHPSCSSQRQDGCDSEFLFCDLKTEWCLSKVYKGGECRGFENVGICYGKDARCAGGKCTG